MDQNTYLVIYTRSDIGIGAERESYTNAKSSQEAADKYKAQGCKVERVYLLTDMAGNWR